MSRKTRKVESARSSRPAAAKNQDRPAWLGSQEPLHEIALLIRSRYSLIALRSHEADRCEGLLHHVADHLRIPFFAWSRARGLRRAGALKGVYGTEDPFQAIAHIESSRYPALYYFPGLEPELEDAKFVAHLQEAVRPYEKSLGALILSAGEIELPAALRGSGVVFTLPSPSKQEYEQLLGHLYRDLSKNMKIESRVSRGELDRLLGNLQGLTLMEAEKVLTKAMVVDGKLAADDIQLVIDAKKEIVETDGALEYFPVEESMADIADLAGLKDWLQQRRELFLRPEAAADYGLSFPKGILLLGVPGCGKSLCAKAVAKEWSLPLLKFDTANLYNKYMGESEKNFKRAIETASRMAPVVLWIDELEKAFSNAGGSEDSGTGQRIFGSFLSWMQDHSEKVFVVATANDIAALPPEFLRKGRFDEIFFVDLPDAEARLAILRIHLRKRKQNPDDFDLDQIVEATEGFSGAEIEQSVVSALFQAFSQKSKLTHQELLRECAATKPLSKTRAEDIHELRQWAKGRVRSAH